MKLNFNKNNKNFSYDLRKINIIYGHSESGKTRLFSELSEALSGKDKSYTLNNFPISKNDNIVIPISNNESIIEQLKLTSKSNVRKLYFDKLNDYFDSNNIIKEINENLKEANNILRKCCSSILCDDLEIKLDVDSDSLINNNIKVELKNNSLSNSKAKRLLFSLINNINSDKENVFILIDDFDSAFDEQQTIDFLNSISCYKYTFILFTNKPTSLPYAINNYGIYTLKNYVLYDFSNIKHILNCALLEQNQENKTETFEEYMLSKGYNESSGFTNKILNNIINNSYFNLGRILTNKNYIISEKVISSKITIVPSNNEEKIFLNYIDKILS